MKPNDAANMGDIIILDDFSAEEACSDRLGEIPKEGRIRICVPYTSKRTLNRIAERSWYGFTSEEVLREKATLAMMYRKIIKGRVLRNKGGTSLDEGKSRVSI